MKHFFFSIAVLATLLLTATLGRADSAREMLESGRVDDAIATLNGRLSSAPSDAESSNLLCRAYLTLENWDGAEAACKRAIALEPGNGSYHHWLGHVYGEKAERANFLTAIGLARKTREEFERAVQLSPNEMDAQIDLAEFYIEAPGIVGGGEDKARLQAKQIGATDPAREHWVYARIAEKNHDSATAEQEYHRMIDASKGDSEAWLNLALFFRHAKRYDDMERALVATSQAPISKPDVLIDVAQNLYRTGRNFTLAVKVIKRYFALGPVEEAPAYKAHYLLGMLLEKQGDKAGAAREYQASLALARQYALAQQALVRVGE